MSIAAPIITIDVEDWPQSTWDHNLQITRRASENTYRLLDLLDELGCKTTMFVLGKLADAFPRVVRDINARGHEIASHGYGHVEIFNQNRNEFVEDVRHAKDLLEQIIGKPVHGYRAPNFSVIHKTLWALEVLEECGFIYDSSIYPFQGFQYGIPDWPLKPAQIKLLNNSSILEFPIAVARCLGIYQPIGGGGYFRLLPFPIIRMISIPVIRNRTFVFYCHPYEFDNREFSEIALSIPLKTRLHQGLGRNRFGKRFIAFVKKFGACCFKDIISTEEWLEFDLNKYLN